MADIESLRAQLKTAEDPQVRLRIVKELGSALAAAGNAAESLRAYEAAHKFAPQDREVVHALRLAAVASGNPPSALPWFQKEVALAPQDRERARLFKELGDHFQNELKDLENAQKAFARARQLDDRVFGAPPPDPVPVAAAPVAVAPPAGPPVRVRPSAPPNKPPAGWGSRKWIAAVVTVLGLLAAGLGGGLFPRPTPAAHASPEFDCAGELKRLADEDDDGVVSVFECSTPLMSRRWRVRAGRVVELASFSRGQREGAITLTPEVDERTEGAYAGNEKTGEWKTFKKGGLTLEEEWVAGRRSGSARRFQRDGGLVELQEWSLNEKNGAFGTWNLAGVKTQEGQYQRGTRTGLWATYDAQGQVIERWYEPRRLDAGIAMAEAGPVIVEELFAGQTLSWWKIRYAEIAQRTQRDPSLEELRQLTLRRAGLAGLRLSETTGLLEVE